MISPRVSVILPVYNGAAYLAETLDSVFAQTYRDLELIVVNDGSTDASEDIILSYPQIRYLHQSNQGVPFARNAGAMLAQGEFLSFIDQDDLWLPGKTRMQVDVFEQNPNLGYSITQQIFYVPQGVTRPLWCPEDWLSKPVAGFSPSTLMIRKPLFEQMERFDTGFITGSDTEFFFRLKDSKVPFVQLEEILVHKRVHQNNQSATSEPLRRDIMETVRRSVQRQRARQTNPNQS